MLMLDQKAQPLKPQRKAFNLGHAKDLNQELLEATRSESLESLYTPCCEYVTTQQLPSLLQQYAPKDLIVSDLNMYAESSRSSLKFRLQSHECSKDL